MLNYVKNILGTRTKSSGFKSCAYFFPVFSNLSLPKQIEETAEPSKNKLKPEHWCTAMHALFSQRISSEHN